MQATLKSSFFEQINFSNCYLLLSVDWFFIQLYVHRTICVKTVVNSFKNPIYTSACDKKVKDQILSVLPRGNGVRGCVVVLGISPDTVLRPLAGQAQAVIIKPKQSRYHKVQVDALWSHVGKKDKNVWLLYAYCAESEEIPGFCMGKRSIKTIENLMVKLKELEVDFYCTDHWEAFRSVLPYYQHLIGKQFTRAIEGVNTFFRTRVRRLWLERQYAFLKIL
jgi:insertion element IS1 protein InsB